MIEILEEFTRSQIPSQVMMIIKKRWFFDFEILEIHQKINWESRQQEPKTITDSPITERQNQSNRNELQCKNNRNTTHPNHIVQPLTRKKKNRYREFNKNYI